MKLHPLLQKINEISDTKSDEESFLKKTAEAIQAHFPHYNWVGFYFLREGRLHIGPYIGKPTPHTVIELDSGICGAAVSSKQTIIVDDVNADPRYLACSLETKSEIVIPLRVGGQLIGELDIDSDRKAAFADDDRILLEEVTQLIGDKLLQFRGN